MRRYYSQVFPAGNNNAKKQFSACKRLLKENPYIGHPTYFEGIREYSISKIPFSFIYQIKQSHIEILRVWDERQDRLK
jgi:plasmid stabilization system protein ParE